jgi:hypothetical protein
MSFTDSTNWFDALAEHAKGGQYPALHVLRAKADLYPTKANLELLRYSVDCLKPAKLRRLIVATIESIQRREFKHEFRYHYHSYPKSASQSSACGELFSLIRQAVDYHA